MTDTRTSEYAVIGSILIDTECASVVLSKLKTEDFEDARCRAGFDAVKSLRNAGRIIDPVIILDEAQKINGKFTFDFAKALMVQTPTAANVEEYCNLVKQGSLQRKLSKIAESIEIDAYNSVPASDTLLKLREDTEKLSNDAENDFISSAAMCEAWEKHDNLVRADPDYAFCKTGYKMLDLNLGGGMFRQGFYIVGARPGMGKTTLGINIAERIAERSKSVLFISLEMSRVQIMSKRIARSGGLSYTKLMNGTLNSLELAQAKRINEKLSINPFYLSDRGLCRVSDIDNMARSIENLSCIVVDYFGLISSEEGFGGRSRYEESTEISKQLKSLAKRLNIPILALCQLNRETAARQDKRPLLSDLRDTGAIEQDADGVILLHRKNYYLTDEEKKELDFGEPETIELIIAKNRHGETGKITLSWEGVSGRIKETDADDPTASAQTPIDELPF